MNLKQPLIISLSNSLIGALCPVGVFESGESINDVNKKDNKKSILPPAIDALVSVKGSKLYCDQYDPPKRQPLGLYNVSLRRVLKSFESVLDALDQILYDEPYRDESQYGHDFGAKIIDCQVKLIKSLQEYFDGCMDALRCFYPANIGSKRKLFWKEPIVDQYWQAIKDDFFDPISNIANHIKHDEGQLIFLVMFNDSYAIPGYFADSVDEEGNISPYRKIHQPVRSKIDSTYGYDTAFSFFRDLRYLLWGVYFVSNHLADAVLAKNGLKQVIEYAPYGKVDDQIINIAKRVSKLPNRFYSDELHKSIPYIEVISDETETILTLEYPSEKLLIALDGKHQNLVAFIGDGISKSYRFPYRRGKL